MSCIPKRKCFSMGVSQMFHPFVSLAVSQFRTQLTDSAPWTRHSLLAHLASGFWLATLVCRWTSRDTFCMTASLAVLPLSTLAQSSFRSWFSPVTAPPTSTSTSWNWTWTRIPGMAWAASTWHPITPLLMFQGGTNQRRILLTPQGGTSTAKMRSLHLTTMLPSLPRPHYPTFLRFRDWPQHDHRLRCHCHRSL